MSSKNIFLSLSVATAIFSNLQAQTIELKKGQNLISFNEEYSKGGNIPLSELGSNIEAISSFGYVANPFTGESTLQPLSVTELEPGQAYWVKSSTEDNVTVDTNGETVEKELQAGWNFVGFSVEDSLLNISTEKEKDGYKLDSVASFGWVSNPFSGTTALQPESVSSFEQGKGYWVKVQKVQDKIVTVDGYEVQLFADAEGKDLSTVSALIESKTISEVASMTSSELDGVANIVVSFSKDGLTLTSPYLDPSSDFKTNLDSVIKNDLDIDVAKEGFEAKGTSLYVYEIEGQGSPKILNGVSVYKAVSTNVDGETTFTKGDLLGETSPTGFLYIPEVSTDEANPTIVLVEKDGYFTATQILRAVEGTANYLYVAKDTSTSFGGGEVDPTVSNRTLERELDASRPGAWRIDMSGEQTGIILYSENTYLTSNEDLEVLGRPNLKTLNNSQKVEEILNEKGYKSELLGSFQTYARDKYKRALYGKSFTDLTNRENSDFKLFLGLTLSDEVLDTLYEDEDKFFEDLELFTYKDGDWNRLGEDNDSRITVYTKEDYDNGSYKADITSRYHQKYVKKFFTGGGNGDENAFLIVDGDLYSGPAPIVAMYKKPVDTKVNTNFVTYNVDVKVLSHDDRPLPKASVTLVRGNALTEITKPVDLNSSTSSFEILATKTAIQDFTIKVIEGEHYPVVKNLSIADLTPIVEGENNSTTTFVIKMKAPPEYAVVKGLVTANNGYGLQNAEVELLYPLSMAEVDQSARKVINNRDEQGVQVSAVPNARYKWFIKKASAIDEEEQANSRTLNRVSEERWTLVQESSASDGGNFLPYSKIVSQAIVSPESADETDLEVVVSGKFQVALQVEHDIDADGKVDFTELATTEASQSNTDGEDFSTTVDENYGVEVGYISTMVDVDALAQEGLKTVDTEKADYYLREGQTDYSKFETLISYDNGAYDFTSSDTNPTDMFSIDTFNDTYASLGLDSNVLSAKFTSRFTIQDDKLKNPSGYQGGYLKLVNTTDGNNDVKNIEWRAVISVYITETDMLYRLAKDSAGNFNWVADEDYKFDDSEWQNDLSKSLIVKSSDSQFIYSRELGKYISQEQVISRLAETIGTMLTTAGEDTSGFTQDRLDSLVFGDGFDIDVYAVVKTEVKDPASSYNGQELTLATDIKLPFKDGLDIKKFLKLDKVSFTPPTFLDPSQTTVTDRVGLYEFPVVPLQYGEMNENLSLLRVEASKLGYYNSPVANVPMFIMDDVNTSEREDIKRLDLNVVEKPTYSIKVNTTDRTTGATVEALVEIDGIRSEQNIAETESTEKQFGSSVTFDHVIGGKGAERIVKISVPDAGNYMPIIKTIPLKSNEELNISLISSDDIPETTARLTVDNFFVDYERGTVNISLTAFDSSDETLTQASELYVFLNGAKVKNPDVEHATGSTEFTINLPLKIGENEVGLQIANLKGFSDKYVLKTTYDPTVGSVNGKVHDFSGAGQLVVDVYTEDNLYFDTVTLPESGEYLFQDLKAGNVFKFQAVEFDENGEVIQISEMKQVKVPVATTFTQDLLLQEIERTAGFPGGDPVFNFIGNDDNSTFIVEDNGTATFSATLSNFDADSDLSSIWFFVNDMAVEVDKSALQNAGSDFYYTIQDYQVQLEMGSNVVYGAAINPDSSFDWTKDFYVDWTPDTANLFSITGTVNGKGEALGYSFVSLYDYSDFSFVGTTEADENGTFEFDNLLDGQYALYVNGGVQYEDFAKLYTVSGGDVLNVELNLTEYVETIDVPDFYVELVSQDTVTAGDTIYLNANLNALDGSIDQADFTFEWKVDGSVVTPTNTTAHQIVTSETTSSYVEVEITITHTESGETSTASKIVYVTPARINSRPTIDSFVVTGDENNDTNTDFVFDVNASDYDGDNLSYSWSINGVANQTYQYDVETISFSSSGDYNVSVVVSDGDKTAETSVIVNVSNAIVANLTDTLSILNNQVTVGSNGYEETKTVSNGVINPVYFDSESSTSYQDILQFSFELGTSADDGEFEDAKTTNLVAGIKIYNSDKAILTVLDNVQVSRNGSLIGMEIVQDSNLKAFGFKADGTELSTTSVVSNPNNFLSMNNSVVSMNFANMLDEIANNIGFTTDTINDTFAKDGSYNFELYFASSLDDLAESSVVSASSIGSQFPTHSSIIENLFSNTIFGFNGTVTVTGNAVPVINNVTITSSDENNDTYSNFTFDVDASDNDGDTLIYSWYVDGSLETETSNSFTANFTNEGTHTVKVEVSDGELSDSETITVEVENGTVIPTPPVIPSL
ncbi:hypothetical protein ThvES_00017770 [Thiovulum sp. ES]|nr:hypothetical protein ThvES_00017770 [Thiovulum sp. ES]